jgi:hypothetical protein
MNGRHRTDGEILTGDGSRPKTLSLYDHLRAWEAACRAVEIHGKHVLEIIRKLESPGRLQYFSSSGRVTTVLASFLLKRTFS